MFQRIMVPTDGSPASELAIPIAERLAAAQTAEVLLIQVIPYLTGPNGFSVNPDIYRVIIDASEQEAASSLGRLKARFESAHIRTRTLSPLGSPAIALLDAEREEKIDLVVVTLDGSGVAEEVLPVVEALAARPIRSVKLFRAVDDPIDRTAARTYLEAVGARLAARGLDTHIEVDVGDPVKLTRRAAQDTDLIILCTHGRGAIDRFRHGSVAERVVRESERPVLLVRAGTPVTQLAEDAASAVALGPSGSM
jgi:nucleotide-binding universal stress UspA family protein